MRCARFSKVSQVDWLSHVSSIGRRFENFLEHPEAQRVWRMKLRPKWPGWIIAIRMVLVPPVQVRYRGNQGNGTLPGFRDCDLQPVAVVRDVADREISELARAGACIECHRDDRGIAIVESGIDHGEDICFPAEHVSGSRLRVVATGGARMDPIDTRWKVSLASVLQMPAKDVEGGSIIAIRLFIIVVFIDPANQIFGLISVFESVRKTTDILCYSNSMPEEFLVTVDGILGFPQIQFVGTFDQCLSVTIGESGIFSTILDTFSQTFQRPLSCVVVLSRLGRKRRLLFINQKGRR